MNQEREERDEGDDGGDAGGGSDGFLEPNGAGVAAQPEETQQPTGASPGRRKGGRPPGSRNRTTLEKEQAAATGVGAPTSRPTGKTGSFPDEVEGKIPNDADQLWMYVLEEVQAKGWTPYDMEIRVDRKLPLPAGPVTEFDASAVMGDATTSPATALRKFVRDWIHLPSGVNGPGLYVLHFCWKNQARFFRRGEIKMPSRNECLAMIQSEEARQSQTGAAGLPTPHFPQQPRAPQQQPQAPQYGPGFGNGYPPPYGFGAPPPQQQLHFDPEAERAKIRAELEREAEIDRMRREIDDLRRRPAYAPPPPQYYPPPQRRGVGAPPPPPVEDDDQRIARVVVGVLTHMGIGPQQQQQPTGVGATPPTLGQVQTMDFVDNMDRALDAAAKTKRAFSRAAEIFGGEAPSKKTGTGSAPAEGDEEDEKPKSRMRFAPTGQKFRGHDTMIPVDEAGDPMIPTTFAEALATGIANPFLLDPLVQGMGAILTQGAGLIKGLGAQPQGPQRADIHVQQVHQQPVQQPVQQQHLPPPTPYSPPPQPQRAPADPEGFDLT